MIVCSFKIIFIRKASSSFVRAAAFFENNIVQFAVFVYESCAILTALESGLDDYLEAFFF